MLTPRESSVMAGHLVQALRGASESFAEDELAYLALTSKVENPLRDRMAWALQSTLAGRLVAREWHRCDLAVLEADGTPAALVEAKAMYSFDGVSSEKMGAYRGWMVSDIAKADRLASGSAAEVYALLFVTHVEGRLNPDVPDGVVKYRRAIERATDPRLLASARTAIGRCVAELGIARHGKLGTGTALGVGVAVEYWLIGPVEREFGR